MIKIRLPKAEWGKAWRAMIEIGPVTLIADDPIYVVLPAHLELWTVAKNLQHGRRTNSPAGVICQVRFVAQNTGNNDFNRVF
jgi:hypothetical protein